MAQIIIIYSDCTIKVNRMISAKKIQHFELSSYVKWKCSIFYSSSRSKYQLALQLVIVNNYTTLCLSSSKPKFSFPQVKHLILLAETIQSVVIRVNNIE